MKSWTEYAQLILSKLWNELTISESFKLFIAFIYSRIKNLLKIFWNFKDLPELDDEYLQLSKVNDLQGFFREQYSLSELKNILSHN